ncbi:MAG: isochorismate synthase [Sporolactobacillus sp.]|nr:isochorismate synthase [Sporolactobacillus sp.]
MPFSQVIGNRSAGHLVSLSIACGAPDPLAFFQAGTAGHRFFWRSPSGTTIVGLGAVYTIRMNAGAQRFKRIARSWQKLMETAVCQGPGPILFGGFSFWDDVAPKYWGSFGSGCFYLPLFMLTISAGESVLTVNLACPASEPRAVSLRRAKEAAGRLLKKVAGRRHRDVADYPLSSADRQPNEWKGRVRQAVSAIRSGVMEKVVLTRTRELNFARHPDPSAVLDRLLDRQPGSFIFCLESGRDYFIGASPERLLYKQGEQIRSACVAGSIRRGSGDDEDRRLGRKLLEDEKNGREHRYVVEMVQAILRPLCVSLEIPEQPRLLKSRNIQHLYTPVRARCAADLSLFELVERLHPTPALGGFPRKPALEWLKQHEKVERGLYGGPIGWCDARGNGEFAVGIRSALIRDRLAVLYAGCGIIDHSEADKEFYETALKFTPMLDGLGLGAANLGTC